MQLLWGEEKEKKADLLFSLSLTASLCHITVDTVCCSRGLLLLYEMWFCKVKGNTVRVGLANMAERGGINAGLYVAQGSRRIMSANDTLSCSHYAVWLASTTRPFVAYRRLFLHVGTSMYVCLFPLCLYPQCLLVLYRCLHVGESWH